MINAITRNDHQRTFLMNYILSKEVPRTDSELHLVSIDMIGGLDQSDTSLFNSLFCPISIPNFPLVACMMKDEEKVEIWLAFLYTSTSNGRGRFLRQPATHASCRWTTCTTTNAYKTHACRVPNLALWSYKT